MAPPSKLTEELQAEIVALVEAGDRPEVAAGVQGISRSTHFEWMRQHERYRTAITCAIDKFESRCRATILDGDGAGVGFGTAKAALEVLSRRMPKHWAQQVKHHVETVEDEFFSALEEVCADGGLVARVCETKDLRFVFAAVCEVLSRREGSEEAASDPIGLSDELH